MIAVQGKAAIRVGMRNAVPSNVVPDREVAGAAHWRSSLRTRKPVLANTTGGFSGPAIFPVALRMVYQVAQAVHIPIVGMGGIMSGRDAAEFMLAGATAVSVGTATLCDPQAISRITNELADYGQTHGLSNIGDIVGKCK